MKTSRGRKAQCQYVSGREGWKLMNWWYWLFCWSYSFSSLAPAWPQRADRCGGASTFEANSDHKHAQAWWDWHGKTLELWRENCLMAKSRSNPSSITIPTRPELGSPSPHATVSHESPPGEDELEHASVIQERWESYLQLLDEYTSWLNRLAMLRGGKFFTSILMILSFDFGIESWVFYCWI